MLIIHSFRAHSIVATLLIVSFVLAALAPVRYAQAATEAESSLDARDAEEELEGSGEVAMASKNTEDDSDAEEAEPAAEEETDSPEEEESRDDTPQASTSKENSLEEETEEESEPEPSKRSATAADKATTTVAEAEKKEAAATTSSSKNQKATTMKEVEKDAATTSIGVSSGTASTTSANTSIFPAATTTTNTTDKEERAYETTSASTAATTTSAAKNSSTTSEFEVGTSTELKETEVVSGDAVAMANILNIVNSSFINSDGVVVFQNFFDTLMEDFDVRTLLNLDDVQCSLLQCVAGGVEANISNEAYIENSLTVEAITGRNTIDGADNASITTGDAYAGVSLVNVANTSVVDSNYLLLTMNAFEDVNGDIVFPGLIDFFSQLGSGAAPTQLTIQNAAEVENTVTTDADAGGNRIDGGDETTISTGDATSGTSVFNQLNTSLAGGEQLSILFRVHGTWAGEIFGAPPGLAWMEDGNGGLYLFDKSREGSLSGSSVAVQASNTAVIRNDVSVVALTGENAISGANTALISTGDAHAGANIMNIANATVVGKNWILAIVNIFGDFNGNIAFGRPDLWVGAKAEVPDKLKNGSEVAYTFTVINNGDSPATNVTLTNQYADEYLELDGVALASTSEGGTLTWQLPDLKPGEAVEVNYQAVVDNAKAGTDIESRVMVDAKETDNNKDDNTDIVVVTTDSSGGASRPQVRLSMASQNDATALAHRIDVVREAAARTVVRGNGEVVTQSLLVTNTSERTLRDVVVHDMLYGPDGALLQDEVWELNDVAPGEKVAIAYDITFGASAPIGTYALRTKVVASGYEDALVVQNGALSVVAGNPLANLHEVLLEASSVVAMLQNRPLAAVLGATTTIEGAASTSDEEPLSLAPASPETPPSFSLFGVPLAYAADSGEVVAFVPAVPAWIGLVGIALGFLAVFVLYRHFIKRHPVLRFRSGRQGYRPRTVTK